MDLQPQGKQHHSSWPPQRSNLYWKKTMLSIVYTVLFFIYNIHDFQVYIVLLSLRLLSCTEVASEHKEQKNLSEFTLYTGSVQNNKLLFWLLYWLLRLVCLLLYSYGSIIWTGLTSYDIQYCTSLHSYCNQYITWVLLYGFSVSQLNFTTIELLLYVGNRESSSLVRY